MPQSTTSKPANMETTLGTGLTGKKLCRRFFFFQAEDGIRDRTVTGVQTCALPISRRGEQLAGLEQRLEPGQDHHPAAVELAVRALAELVVGHGQPARVADRLDLPGDPQIGSASCRERVEHSAGGGPPKKRECMREE